MGPWHAMERLCVPFLRRSATMGVQALVCCDLRMFFRASIMFDYSFFPMVGFSEQIPSQAPHPACAPPPRPWGEQAESGSLNHMRRLAAALGNVVLVLELWHALHAEACGLPEKLESVCLTHLGLEREGVALLVKPVRTPVAILGSLGVCIYVPASRHWLISYSPIHLT